MKVLLPPRVFLIISVLWLTATPTYSFFQNKSSKNKVKYEFTDTRISQADTLLKKREYAKALEAYEKAYDTYEAEGFYEGMVYARERMGLCFRRLKRNNQSLKYYREATVLAKEFLSDENLLLSKVYSNNALRAHFRNNWVEASYLIDSAGWAYNRASSYDSSLLKTIIDFKFYTYYYSGLSNDTLVKYLNEKARFYDLNGSSLEESIYLLSDYNRAYYRIGDYQKSVAYGLEAVRQSEQSEELIQPFYYTDALFHLGRSLYAQKKYDRSLNVSDKLIAYTLDKDPQGRDLTSYYNLRAVNLNLLGRYKEAANQFLEILNVLKAQNKNDDFFIHILMNLGVCYQRMGEFERAEKYLFDALELQKKVKTFPDVAFADRYKYIGQFFSSQNKFDLATNYYDSAVRSAIQDYYGDILEFPKEPQKNLSYETLTILKNKQLNLEESFLSHFNDSLMLLSSSLNYGERVHEYLITNREKLRASEGKLFLSNSFKDLYESALNASYILYKNGGENKNSFFKKANKFLRLSKANLFLEQSGELERIQDSRLDLKTKNRYFNLQSSIDSLEQRFYELIDEIATNEEIRKINSVLISSRKRLEDFRDSLNLSVNEFDDKVALTVEETIKKKIRSENDRGIIEFFVGERYTFIVGQTAGKSVFKRIVLDSLFDNSFEFLIQEVTNKPAISNYRENLIKYQDHANLVYQYLLEAVLKEFGKDITKLTIIPDEKLSKLPFEALVSSSNPKANYYSDLRFMLNNYVINYSLSTSEIKLKPTERSSKKELLGIGYSGGGTSKIRSNYGSLGGTEDEVRYLKSRINGDFLIGSEGSKSSFLQSAREYDILHLAIHGEADNNDRYQSSLIFNGDRDNVLKTSDLYVAGLNARLAVLSACESGIGEINKGEGTFSIARGFALVGVPSIVMSLWKVNDKEAAKLISGMYENLLGGQSIDFALSMAKREYLKNSEQFTSHPYYWSAFVSLGEEVEIEPEKALTFEMFLILSLVIILICFITFALIKKRKGS